MITASTDVLARYDELATLLAGTAGRAMADPTAVTIAARFIHREARLLDGRCFRSWLDDFSADAVLWVPLAAGRPDADQSLYLDDRRRLAERVAWHERPSSWAQHPPSTCVRVIGGVEAWDDRGGRIVAESTLIVYEQRLGQAQWLAGRQVHELVDGPAGWRCRSKILVVPQLAMGVRNPSFLL
ncbi:MAG: aromatic-ring-hydroxylating dioxygenase subunit beta [Ilumatobacteraceae bacterium]